MRAIQWTEFGNPSEVLRLCEVPAPHPARGEVRVRMLCSPINPSDLMTVRGIYGTRPFLPATPGYEGVGIVEESNAGLLGRYLKGRRVAVLNRNRGNWCEQTVVPARQAIPLPTDLPLDQSAMFFVNPASAYLMTREVLAVPKDEWLLQTAAGSALGKMVIRLAKRFGFRTLNVVRRSDQADELKSLGADAVIVFDAERHSPEELAARVSRATQRPGVRFAIDPVGGATGSAVVHCLGDDARMLVYGTLSDQPLCFSQRLLMSHGTRIEGFWLSRVMQSMGLLGKLKLIRTLTRLLRDGTLRSEVAQIFPLDQIAEAVQAAERPGKGGKVLLQISQ